MLSHKPCLSTKKVPTYMWISCASIQTATLAWRCNACLEGFPWLQLLIFSCAWSHLCTCFVFVGSCFFFADRFLFNSPVKSHHSSGPVRGIVIPNGVMCRLALSVWSDLCGRVLRREGLGLLTLHVSASLLAAAHSAGCTGKSSELCQLGCPHPSLLFPCLCRQITRKHTQQTAQFSSTLLSQ